MKDAAFVGGHMETGDIVITTHGRRTAVVVTSARMYSEKRKEVRDENSWRGKEVATSGCEEKKTNIICQKESCKNWSFFRLAWTRGDLGVESNALPEKTSVKQLIDHVRDLPLPLQSPEHGSDLDAHELSRC
jgi:hypothetical protein